MLGPGTLSPSPVGDRRPEEHLTRPDGRQEASWNVLADAERTFHASRTRLRRPRWGEL